MSAVTRSHLGVRAAQSLARCAVGAKRNRLEEVKETLKSSPLELLVEVGATEVERKERAERRKLRELEVALHTLPSAGAYAEPKRAPRRQRTDRAQNGPICRCRGVAGSS